MNATLQTESFEHWLNASLARVLSAWGREGRSLDELCIDWIDGPELEPKVIAVKSEPRWKRVTLTVSARSWVWMLPRAIAEGPANQALSELLWPAQEQVLLLEHKLRRVSEAPPPSWLEDWPAEAQLRVKRAWQGLRSRRGTESGLRELLSLLLEGELELAPVPLGQGRARIGDGSRLGHAALASVLDLWVCRLPAPECEAEQGALRRRLQAIIDSECPLSVQVRLEFVESKKIKDGIA